jgi:hypothetical protein
VSKETPNITPEENREKEHVEKHQFVRDNVRRRTDGRGVIIKGSGLEMEMSEFLTQNKLKKEEYVGHLEDFLKTAGWNKGLGDLFDDYDSEKNEFAVELVEKHIKNKRVLVVPAYATNPYLFKLIGAKEVVGADADPVTIDWQKAIQEHFYTNDIGEVLMATGNYPDMVTADGIFKEKRGTISKSNYQDYIANKVRKAVMDGVDKHPIEGVRFIQGSLATKEDISTRLVDTLDEEDKNFDFIYVPFLLGVRSGIDSRQGISDAYNDLWELGHDGSMVMIAPFADSSEDIWDNFGYAENAGKILKKLLPKSKFEFIDDFTCGDISCAVFKIKKKGDTGILNVRQMFNSALQKFFRR